MIKLLIRFDNNALVFHSNKDKLIFKINIYLFVMFVFYNNIFVTLYKCKRCTLKWIYFPEIVVETKNKIIFIYFLDLLFSDT